MNWLKAIKQLLGVFWADLFGDGDFLLGVEYLLFLYSRLTQNQYLNWRNGMIAADLSVAQTTAPYPVFIKVSDDTDQAITREWYQWNYLWTAETATHFLAHTYLNGNDEQKMGWVAFSKERIPCPDYLVDHLYSYNKILIKGLDYDFSDGKFLFYTDPAELGLELVLFTDENGQLQTYYKFFGIAMNTQTVCDPVTGFESEWLNPCSDIAWDIHQNGATYYNTKLLLGKAVGAIVSENDGTVDDIWMEQDWHCLSVSGRAYMSKDDPNYAVGAAISKGDVLFGKLAVYKGYDDVTEAQVPGIKVMTDAGQLTALNDDTAEPYEVEGMLVLPLVGDNLTVQAYKDICAANMKNDLCPYVQVGTYNVDTQKFEVNPYKFITKTLRRGRAVTVRLVAKSLDYLAAAVNCIRKSCCASGIVNIYVATEAETDDYTGAMVKLLSMSTSAPVTFKLDDKYYNTTTGLIYTAVIHKVNDNYVTVWSTDGYEPTANEIYLNLDTDKVYKYADGSLVEVTMAYGARYSTLTTSVFAADAGMMAVAVVDTLNIKAESAEAQVTI